MGILVELQRMNQYDEKNLHYKFSWKPFHKIHQVQRLISKGKNQRERGKKWEQKEKLKIKKTPNFFDKHNKRGNIIEFF
jgi:hypothetical protein